MNDLFVFPSPLRLSLFLTPWRSGTSSSWRPFRTTPHTARRGVLWSSFTDSCNPCLPMFTAVAVRSPVSNPVSLRVLLFMEGDKDSLFVLHRRQMLPSSPRWPSNTNQSIRLWMCPDSYRFMKGLKLTSEEAFLLVFPGSRLSLDSRVLQDNKVLCPRRDSEWPPCTRSGPPDHLSAGGVWGAVGEVWVGQSRDYFQILRDCVTPWKRENHDIGRGEKKHKSKIPGIKESKRDGFRVGNLSLWLQGLEALSYSSTWYSSKVSSVYKRDFRNFKLHD